MKRKAFTLLLCLLLLSSLVLNVSASLPMVVDIAGLLTNDEQSALETEARKLRSEYGMDVVILTVDSLNGHSIEGYADDYFDYSGYGYGSESSGILFLLAMEEREWYISTCGSAIRLISDGEIHALGDAAVTGLSHGAYYEAFRAYLNTLPGCLEGNAEKNAPSLFLSLLIGAVTAAVAVLVMRFSMNTKRQQRGASGYMKAGSFHLRRHQDLFLYSNVSKTRRQQNNSGGGGSSHRSSSGRRHGGGGGRF